MPSCLPLPCGLTAYYFFMPFIFPLKLENNLLPLPCVHHINCSGREEVSSIYILFLLLVLSLLDTSAALLFNFLISLLLVLGNVLGATEEVRYGG